jgi:WD40 repeat protein
MAPAATAPKLVVLAADGSVACLALGTPRGTIELYDGNSGSLIRSAQRVHTQHATGLAISGDGKVICSCDGGPEAFVHDGRGSHLATVCEIRAIACVAVSLDGRFIATGSWGPTASIYCVAPLGDCALICVCDSAVFRGGLSSVALSAGGRLLLAGGEDKSLALFDSHQAELEEGARLCWHVPNSHRHAVTAVSLVVCSAAQYGSEGLAAAGLAESDGAAAVVACSSSLDGRLRRRDGRSGVLLATDVETEDWPLLPMAPFEGARIAYGCTLVRCGVPLCLAQHQLSRGRPCAR